VLGRLVERIADDVRVQRADAHAEECHLRW